MRHQLARRGPRRSRASTRSGRCIVAVDPRYFRPTEVDSLLGDASKARAKLGWTPRIRFAELVAEMMREDLKAAERDALVKKHGFAALRLTTSNRADAPQPAQDLRRRPSRHGRARPSCGRSQRRGARDIVTRTHAELDLTAQADGARLLRAPSGRSTCCSPRRRSAASTPTTPIRPSSSATTSRSQTNVIHEAWRAGVRELLFLGSSCIYPRLAPAADARGRAAHRPARADQRAVRDRQDRRHQAVRVVQPPVRHRLPQRDADQPLRAGRQLPSREQPRDPRRSSAASTRRRRPAPRRSSSGAPARRGASSSTSTTWPRPACT